MRLSNRLQPTVSKRILRAVFFAVQIGCIVLGFYWFNVVYVTWAEDLQSPVFHIYFPRFPLSIGLVVLAVAFLIISITGCHGGYRFSVASICMHLPWLVIAVAIETWLALVFRTTLAEQVSVVLSSATNTTALLSPASTSTTGRPLAIDWTLVGPDLFDSVEACYRCCVRTGRILPSQNAFCQRNSSSFEAYLPACEDYLAYYFFGLYNRYIFELLGLLAVPSLALLVSVGAVALLATESKQRPSQPTDDTELAQTDGCAECRESIDRVY
ncbi:uncharacterized protein BJ171DRAFT_581498 [Polychytrium aggregatum]|uniref:uncharacterized protein n=1 Tax=Polychytrium aggregatum TaxID=110093 RepID=UPI0022FE04DB|nr:uncharacterized protein BJ171DRAFT_581498 [Polychytrium aggregatum]KAI9204813.1 hypothetical protein BJ171DRAFT_581498 [Polychytrium aggregatum]